MPNATRLMQRTKVNGKNSINFTSESEKQQQSVLKNELCCLHTAVSRPFSKNFPDCSGRPRGKNVSDSNESFYMDTDLVIVISANKETLSCYSLQSFPKPFMAFSPQQCALLV